MTKISFIVISDQSKSPRQFGVSKILVKGVMALGLFFSFSFGYFVFDYFHLRDLREKHEAISLENKELKSEAHAAIKRFTEIEESLGRVKNYTNQLTEITNIKIKKVKNKTGIGPLSPEEYTLSENQILNNTDLPSGVTNLHFRPVFEKISSLNSKTFLQELELQQILSNLSQKKSLLASIPSISPVRGWVTSSFGPRISPFTGIKSAHKGIDIASSMGAPVYTPADGVVIFNGKKDGFGNFIMIAHGYGVVTRYGHNAQNLVQAGQRVSRGEQIATVGMSGRTTGPHLHYEVVYNGINVNPSKFILNHNNGIVAH